MCLVSEYRKNNFNAQENPCSLAAGSLQLLPNRDLQDGVGL